MDEARTQVTIEIVDDRGNVVVAVDGGARFAGTLRRVPEVLSFGARLDVMLVVGDEAAALALRVMASADVSAGVVVGAVVLQLDVGGLDLVPRPTVAISNSSSDGVGLSGDIVDVPMAELVQLLCATRRTAEVEMRHLGRFLGTLCFADGRAVSARTVDGIEGTEAFYALAGLEVGAFAVRYNRRASAENLTGDTLFLLLESARRVDEARRVVEDAADDAELVTTAPGAATTTTTAPSTSPPPLPRRSTSSNSSSSSSGKKKRSSDRTTPPGDATVEQPRRTAASMGQFSGFFSEFTAARAHQKSQEGGSAKSQEGVAVDPDDVVEEHPVAVASLKPDFGDMADKDTDIIGRDAVTIAAE